MKDNLHKQARKYFENIRGDIPESELDNVERRAKSRRKAARYTIEEAAVFIGKCSSANTLRIFRKLENAMHNGTLPVHCPGEENTYDIKEEHQSRPWRDEAFWDDINEWLDKNEKRIGCIFPNPDTSATITKIKDASHKSSIGKDWKEQARMIADECFDADTNNNCRDSLVTRKKKSNGTYEIVGGYAYRVMEIMQERKIHGPRGRIGNANTVMREALQGKKWWANKPK